LRCFVGLLGAREEVDRDHEEDRVARRGRDADHRHRREILSVREADRQAAILIELEHGDAGLDEVTIAHDRVGQRAAERHAPVGQERGDGLAVERLDATVGLERHREIAVDGHRAGLVERDDAPARQGGVEGDPADLGPARRRRFPGRRRRRAACAEQAGEGDERERARGRGDVHRRPRAGLE
jgi:hypothetical protein